MPYVSHIVIGTPVVPERWNVYNTTEWSQTDKTGITDNLGYPLLGTACYVSMGAVRETKRTLSHFTKGDGLRAILRGGKLWASEKAALNDGGEAVFAREHLGRIIRMRAPSLPHVEELVAALSAIDFTNLFITSFSSSGNILSVFRLYSDRDGGSLGFPIEVLNEAIRHIPGARIADVIYDAQLQLAALEPLALKTIGALRSALTPDRIGDFLAAGFADEFRRVAPTIKNPDWEDEREVRILALNPPSHLVKTRPGTNGPIRHIEVDFRLAYQHADDVDLHFTTSFVHPGPLGERRMANMVKLFRQREVKFGSISIPSADLR